MLRRLSVAVFIAGLAGPPTTAFQQSVRPSSERPRLGHRESSRLSMACMYSIDAYRTDGDTLPGVLEEAFDEVDRIDRLMSHYKAESPLSRINRDAARAPVTVDPELFDFLVEAMRYGRDSEGAFDITVGPLMKVWGFFKGDGAVPSETALINARRHVGAAHVTLNRTERTIRFDENGVELDLGGIAKGYAIDRVVQLLRKWHVAAALVSAGGSTIYALGAPPGRPAWDVEIQDPIDARRIARTVALKDRALSIAGSSEKSFISGGIRYSHIMDPRTGNPVQGILSVAVLTASGTVGDALDDALFVLGPARGRELLKKFGGTEVFFFLPDPGHAWTMVHQKATP